MAWPLSKPRIVCYHVRMVIGIKSRQVIMLNATTGEQVPLTLDFEADGTLIVADALSDVPRFVHRVKFDRFPTDELVYAAVSSSLGAPHEPLPCRDRTVELDESALAGLSKMPVDIFDNVYLDEVENDALVLCVDIRNFSSFLCAHVEETVFALIKDFTSNFLSCVNQYGCACSYYKLMGDGAIVIWDKTTETTAREALLVFDSYIDFANESLFKPYDGLGLAGALVTEKVFKYEISAETSQLKYRDYVGYGINLACRLQCLARKDQLAINGKLAATGLVPYAAAPGGKRGADLCLLKGLKDEDCRELLLYNPIA